MLTRFITSQHGHGDYPCMGIINSLSIQEKQHLLLCSLTLVGQTHSGGSLTRDRSSQHSFLSTPPLSFSPFLHFTHLQPDGLTGMKSQAQLSPPFQSLTLNAKPLNQQHAAWWPGTSYVQAFGVSYNRGSSSGRGPTEGGRRHRRPRTNDRDNNTFATGDSLCVTGRFPAKLGFQPIKLEL